MNLNIGHALKHIDNSIFLIGGEEEPGIAETFALYTALNTSIETQILPKTKHMPQMEAPAGPLRPDPDLLRTGTVIPPFCSRPRAKKMRQKKTEDLLIFFTLSKSSVFNF